MVGTNQNIYSLSWGHKESAPAVSIPKFRRPYHSYPYSEILTNGYAYTGVPSPFAIHCTFSIVIGRDFRTIESLPNQIPYLFRPTMSCNAAFMIASFSHYNSDLGHNAHAKVIKKIYKRTIRGTFYTLFNKYASS